MRKSSKNSISSVLYRWLLIGLARKIFSLNSLYTPLRSVTSGLRRPSPLTCAVGHAATFAVNAALVASRSAAREAFPCTHSFPSTRLHMSYWKGPILQYDLMYDAPEIPNKLISIHDALYPQVLSRLILSYKFLSYTFTHDLTTFLSFIWCVVVKHSLRHLAINGGCSIQFLYKTFELSQTASIYKAWYQFWAKVLNPTNNLASRVFDKIHVLMLYHAKTVDAVLFVNAYHYMESEKANQAQRKVLVQVTTPHKGDK